MAESKLPPDQYLLCLKMYAQGNSPAKIYKYLTTNNISRPSERNLYDMFKRDANQEIIKREREIYYSKIADVPIMNKRVRADKLQRLITILEDTIENKLIDKKNNTLKISKESFKKVNELLRRLNDMLISARDEMEKRPGNIVQVFTGDMTLEELLANERDIDKKLQFKRAEGISIAVIGEGEIKETQASDDQGKPA